MRVTQQLMNRNVLSNIQRNLGQMGRLQDMLSSGKVLHKPSDNPIDTAQVLSYNTAISRNEQYQKNISAAKSWMDITEDSLQGINDVLQRARELALSGANGTMSQSARDAIAMEVDELTNVLVQMGNSSYQGRYIFAGFKTGDVPFTRDKNLLTEGENSSVAYHGNQGNLSWEVAPQVTVRGNIDGQDLFMDADIFEIMDRLQQALLDGDGQVISDSIGHLTVAHDHILDKRAAIGAITNGLDMTAEKYISEKINFSELRSKLEDIDFAETYMNFAVMENIYRASISTGARIIQPSLLDFLR